MAENRGRRLAAVILFALASLALLATTPGPPTARSKTSGETYVAPGEPARVQVRFTVMDPEPDEVVGLTINRAIGSGPDDPFSVTGIATIEGRDDRWPLNAYRTPLDASACAAGCDVVATLDLSWNDEPEPGLRVAWELELEVVYRNNVPEASISRTVVTGGDAAPPRLTWLALGAIVAAGVGAGLWTIRPRFGVLRLVLAAGLLLVAAWPVVMLGPYVDLWLAGRLIVGQESIAVLGAGLALGVGVIVGIVRAARGRATFLRAVGWIAALGTGYVWWAIAINVGTYRPHEMTAVTSVLGILAVAAITAVPLGRDPAPRTAGLATSFVLGVQWLLLVTTVLAAAAILTIIVVGLVGGQPPGLEALGIALAAIALALTFVIGLREWHRGSRQVLAFGNAIAVVAALLLGAPVLLGLDGGFLSFGVEMRVLAGLVILTVVGGAVGLRLIGPPLADDQRDRERGKGDEIRRVADEHDRARPWDGP